MADSRHTSSQDQHVLDYAKRCLIAKDFIMIISGLRDFASLLCLKRNSIRKRKLTHTFLIISESKISMKVNSVHFTMSMSGRNPKKMMKVGYN